MNKLISTVAAAAAIAFALVNGAAYAQTTAVMPMAMPAVNSADPPDGFGKTDDYDNGYTLQDVYTHGFYCDKSIKAKSLSGCEVGVNYKVPPAKNFDPLYITVPLGFFVPPMQMQCPNVLRCIDHPMTIDLTAIGGPPSALTPGHNHFTTTVNNFEPEWWNVEVIGVTTKATYDAINAHRSFAYIQQLINSGNKTVTKPIATNLFLFFAVKQPPKN